MRVSAAWLTEHERTIGQQGWTDGPAWNWAIWLRRTRAARLQVVWRQDPLKRRPTPEGARARLTGALLCHL